GETEQDFQATLALTEFVRYDNQFSFIFSPRPRTVAGLKESVWGPVPHEVKVERLERLQAVQRRIGTEIAGELVGPGREVLVAGQGVEVVVEGPSRSHPERRFGRTPENRTVNFDGSAPAGARARVRIERATPNALSGTEVALVDLPPVPPLRPEEAA